MKNNWVKRFGWVKRAIDWVRKEPGLVKRYFLFAASYNIAFSAGLAVGGAFFVTMILLSVIIPGAFAAAYIGFVVLGLILGPVNKLVIGRYITSVYDFRKAGADPARALVINTKTLEIGRALWGQKSFFWWINMPEDPEGDPIVVPIEIPAANLPKEITISVELRLAQIAEGSGGLWWFRYGILSGDLLHWAICKGDLIGGIQQDFLYVAEKSNTFERFAIDLNRRISLEERARDVLTELQSVSFGPSSLSYSISVTVIDKERKTKVTVW